MSDATTEPDGDLLPVDPPEQSKTIHATALAVRDTEKRPIVPAWARNRDEARQLARWLAKYGLHIVLYHLTRSPKYAAKLLVHAPIGVFVALLAVLGWVLDREASPLRADAVHRKSVAEYMTLSKQRNQRVKQRATIAGVGLLVLVAVTVWAAVWAPGGPRPCTSWPRSWCSGRWGRHRTGGSPTSRPSAAPRRPG
ncbi:hypothetical protein BJF78_24620 [Pseudonocardia sp. CNS-139]|nr:hypothetical protein BJF78_24620 [Pseudonocardia sp. CNS-139]